MSLDLPSAKVICITGPSGAGKSTLLHIIGTLDKADSGEVLYNGQNIAQLKDKELAKFRNQNIGFVFQFHHLLPEFTALENVALPALISGLSKKEAFKKGKELLDFLKFLHNVLLRLL